MKDPAPPPRRLVDEYPERVRPFKLAHCVLRLPTQYVPRGWYLNMCDARVAYENDQSCFLTYDDEHHRIGILVCRSWGNARIVGALSTGRLVIRTRRSVSTNSYLKITRHKIHFGQSIRVSNHIF